MRTLDARIAKRTALLPWNENEETRTSIVNALSALAISALRWWYMKRREHSFIEAWIRKFIERNPRLFRP